MSKKTFSQPKCNLEKRVEHEIKDVTIYKYFCSKSNENCFYAREINNVKGIFCAYENLVD